MFIIMYAILNNWHIIMKKVLSMFVSLFVIFGFLAVNFNLVIAQWDRPESVGANFNNNCLTWMWQWCLTYETMIWMKDYQPGSGYTATSIAQDLVVSATYMVWTVLTIAIVYCWLKYIFASAWGKDPKDYWKRLIQAAIWAVLVWWAYAIVRLIQYIARW